jgi:twitching motility protein PilT
MLRALAERGARELVLSEGARPSFRFPEGDRPVSQAVLSRAQIVALLGELAGHDAPSLADGRAARFAYRTAEGRVVIVEASAASGKYAARLFVDGAEGPVPVSLSAAATAPPAETPAPPSAAPESRFDPSDVRPGAPAIEAYLRYLVRSGSSDLHLSAAEVPMIRLHGDMARIEGASVLSPEESARLLFQLMPPTYRKEFDETNDTDFAHEIPGVARFRCNVFADRKGVGGVFRVIPSKIPTAEEMGLSKPILDLCFLSKGLVLVTGPTGSGKSTTLAALVDYINRNRTAHIITIEDPIEFVHPNKKCLVNQREVGTHTGGFKKALRAALREDPDIVLVGEMRDLETIAIAIETAETGHLVFGTLHTSTAPSTVDRIIDQFPADRQSQIRVMLSESLKGVISQMLLKKKSGGRVAAMEVLIGVPAVSNLIREGKTFQIPSIMQTGRKHGMVMLNDALIEIIKKGVVTADEAYVKAVDKAGLLSQMKSAGLDAPTLAGSGTAGS